MNTVRHRLWSVRRTYLSEYNARAVWRITLHMDQLIADVSKLFEDDDPTVNMTEFMPPANHDVALDKALAIGESVQLIPASN